MSRIKKLGILGLGAWLMRVCFQAVPLGQDPAAAAAPPRAVYDWQDATSSLFAAGGAQPAIVHRWDLNQELCTQQVLPPLLAKDPLVFAVACKCTAQWQCCYPFYVSLRQAAGSFNSLPTRPV